MLSSKRELDKGGWIAILIYFRTLAMASLFTIKVIYVLDFRYFLLLLFILKFHALNLTIIMKIYAFALD